MTERHYNGCTLAEIKSGAVFACNTATVAALVAEIERLDNQLDSLSSVCGSFDAENAEQKAKIEQLQSYIDNTIPDLQLDKEGYERTLWAARRDTLRQVREGLREANFIMRADEVFVLEVLTRLEQEAPASTCHWTEDSDGGWHGDCGKFWMLNDGGPDENEVAFCPRCGKPMTWEVYQEPPEDEDEPPAEPEPCETCEWQHVLPEDDPCCRCKHNALNNVSQWKPAEPEKGTTCSTPSQETPCTTPSSESSASPSEPSPESSSPAGSITELSDSRGPRGADPPLPPAGYHLLPKGDGHHAGKNEKIWPLATRGPWDEVREGFSCNDAWFATLDPPAWPRLLPRTRRLYAWDVPMDGDLHCYPTEDGWKTRSKDFPLASSDLEQGRYARRLPQPEPPAPEPQAEEPRTCKTCSRVRKDGINLRCDGQPVGKDHTCNSWSAEERVSEDRPDKAKYPWGNCFPDELTSGNYPMTAGGVLYAINFLLGRARLECERDHAARLDRIEAHLRSKADHADFGKED